jgi:hypothetical protein
MSNEAMSFDIAMFKDVNAPPSYYYVEGLGDRGDPFPPFLFDIKLYQKLHVYQLGCDY